MITVQHLNELKHIFPPPSPVALTIGNFDGVHLGHQYLLKQLAQESRSRGWYFAVMTFVPHPWAVLVPEKKFFLIDSYREKRDHLLSLGVDILIEIPFTRDFSNLEPHEFMAQYLFSPHIDLKLLCLGHDFAFGNGKRGNSDWIAQNYQNRDFILLQEEAFQRDSYVISSSLIRNKIGEGEMDLVNRLLGRPYKMRGKVIKGLMLGRLLGYPTANIEIESEKIMPRYGVYRTQTVYKNQLFDSITNIGENPTLNMRQIRCETHLLNFNSEIYGEEIEVQFLSFIRDEKKFANLEELKLQIELDIQVSQKNHI